MLADSADWLFLSLILSHFFVCLKSDTNLIKNRSILWVENAKRQQYSSRDEAIKNRKLSVTFHQSRCEWSERLVNVFSPTFCFKSVSSFFGWWKSTQTCDDDARPERKASKTRRLKEYHRWRWPVYNYYRIVTMRWRPRNWCFFSLLWGEIKNKRHQQTRFLHLLPTSSTNGYKSMEIVNGLKVKLQ